MPESWNPKAQAGEGLGIDIRDFWTKLLTKAMYGCIALCWDLPTTQIRLHLLGLRDLCAPRVPQV